MAALRPVVPFVHPPLGGPPPPPLTIADLDNFQYPADRRPPIIKPNHRFLFDDVAEHPWQSCNDLTEPTTTLTVDTNDVKFIFPVFSARVEGLFNRRFLDDTLKTSEDTLVFPTANDWTQLVTANFPTPGEAIFVLRNDVEHDKIVIDEIAVRQQRDLSNVRYVTDQYLFSAPYSGWTFWDSIPETIPQRMGGEDFLLRLQDLVRGRYTKTLCKDQISNEKMAWFLVYWLVNRTTASAMQHVEDVNANRVNLDDAQLPALSLLHHAFNILDLILRNPIMASGMFQPFIRGFVDDPESWILSKVPGNEDALYLQLPDDPEDSLASILRAHPNTYLVRLSPSKPMHIDYIMYRVKDVEKETRARRKYEEYVVFFSVDLLRSGRRQCPAAMRVLMYMMNHMHYEDLLPTDQRAPKFRPLDFVLALDALMRRKAKSHPDKLPASIIVAPIMANLGSAQAYYQSLCSDPNVLATYRDLPDYESIVTSMGSVKGVFDYVFRMLFPSTQLDPELVTLYRNYLTTATFCSPLYPMIDNFGDAGCAVSPTWMIEHIPEQAPNELMARIYNYVKDRFYSGCLWECERTIAGAAKEGVGWSEAPETVLRQQHIWHLIRWLGMDYFVRAFQADGPDPWIEAVNEGLKLILYSSFAYPFASPEMGENMLAQLGPAARKSGFVLRLSTSTPLAFEQRTTNPKYNPADPDSTQYTYQIIRGTEWQHWLSGASPEYIERITSLGESRATSLKNKLQNLFRDIAIKNPFYTVKQIELQLREYLLRRGLYRKHGLVLIRNLRTIEQYLASCHVNVAARVHTRASSIWWAFRDATNEEQLERLDVLVEKAFPGDKKEWEAIKSKTLSVNARGEGALLGLVSGLCRPGTYARINFDRLHRPVCDENEAWLLDQPLLTEKFLKELQAVKNPDDRAVARGLADTRDLLLASAAFTNNWCVSGRRGDRNLSAVINWLGYDTVKFVAANKNALTASPPTFQPQSPAEFEHLLALNCIMDLSRDPSFHLLINPVEADILACTYPGFAVVNLSASTSHALRISYVDPEDLFQIQHSDLLMSDLQPLYRPEISLSVWVRLVVFSTRRAYLAPAYQPVEKYDQAGCKKATQKRPTQPELTINFAPAAVITNQYASLVLSLLLSGAMDFDKAAVEQWYTREQQRWMTIHPFLGTLKRAKDRLSQYFDYVRQAAGAKLTNMGQWLNFTNREWWSNPTNWWYATETITGQMFQEELVPLVERFLKNETEYAATYFVPTDVPTLLKKIGAAEEDSPSDGLVRDALRYREKEFRGEAYQSAKETKAMEKEIKATVFGTLRDKYQKWREGAKTKSATDATEAPLSTAPDTIYDQLKFMQRLSPPSAAQRLLEKIRSGEPLGPGETKIGIELNLLNAGGQLLQRGLAPQFMPRVTESAGPLSEFQVSGPAFQLVKATDWKQFNEQGTGEDPVRYLAKLEDFESREGCSDNGPDYVFPAFDVDSQGRILARCGRPGWMSAAPTITKDQFDRLDDTNQKLLLALRNLAQHWCPTPAHELRLWRWIGISCLGKRSIDILSTLALDRLDDPSNANATPIKQLSEQSRAEQRKLIQQFRERSTRAKNTRQDPSDVCKKRVLFLQQMISSNILFPYLPDSKNARVLAGYNPERVVVMLGWGKSGSVIAMRDGRKFLEHEYQAEDLVEYMQYVPTTVRLRIFHDFYGGICANNYDFYTRVLHQSGQQKCLKSLADMKRFAVRAALSMADQRRLDEIYGQVVASGNITAEQRQTLEELQNISLLLQAKNLSTTELYIYEEIRKLENLPANDKQVLELAERLYKSKEVDVRLSEAEQFEALALCQRPEFVPYLRRKLKEKYPELSMAEIEAMDREHLCRVLINNPGLEQLKMPVLLWQIKSIPTEYRNTSPDGGGLLDIWTRNPSRQREINDWLMKNYGVTLKQIQDDNRDSYNEEMLAEQAARYQEEADQRVTAETKRVEDLVVFREFLTNGAQCPYVVRLPGGQEELNLCEETRLFVTTDGHELTLRNAQDERKSLPTLDLFSIVYANLCHPAVPLLMNDFEFILQSFNTLKNYFALRKYQGIPSERRLDKQCKVIQQMYNKLMEDARQAAVDWLDFPLPDILKNTKIKDFYIRLRKGVEAKTPLRYAWSAFALKERKSDEHITFAFAVLLLIAELNGIVTLQHP